MRLLVPPLGVPPKFMDAASIAELFRGEANRMPIAGGRPDGGSGPRLAIPVLRSTRELLAQEKRDGSNRPRKQLKKFIGLLPPNCDVSLDFVILESLALHIASQDALLLRHFSIFVNRKYTLMNMYACIAAPPLMVAHDTSHSRN